MAHEYLSARYEKALRRLLDWSWKLAVGEDTEARRNRTIQAVEEVERLFFPDEPRRAE